MGGICNREEEARHPFASEPAPAMQGVPEVEVRPTGSTKRISISAPAAAARRSSRKNSGALNKLTKEKEYQILILGISGVGKSTFFKQLKCLYGGGFSELELLSGRIYLLKNLLGAMRFLVKFAIDTKLIELTPEIESSYERLDTVAFEDVDIGNQDILDLVKEGLVSFWSLPDVKALLTTNKCMDESLLKLRWAAYFFEKAVPLYSNGYIMTPEDMIILRRQTEGSKYMYFNLPDQLVHVQYIGGQMHEQRIWPQYYDEKLNCLVYMISAIDFAFTLDSREQRNRLVYSLFTLKELLLLNELKGIPFIIVFNKIDEIRQYLGSLPWSPLSPKFKVEPTSAEELVEIMKEFIQDLVSSMPHPFNSRHISYYSMCATSQESVRMIFTAILAEKYPDQA